MLRLGHLVSRPNPPSLIDRPRADRWAGRNKAIRQCRQTSSARRSPPVEDGVLVWKERPRSHFPERPDDQARFNGQRAGSEAGYPGPDGRLMAQFTFGGKIRRIAASRIAWVLATSEWPQGQVRCSNGDEGDLRPENLIVAQRGKNPAAIGKSSLEGRLGVDAKLIAAMAGHPDSSVARLGELAGLTESGACNAARKAGRKGIGAVAAVLPQQIVGADQPRAGRRHGRAPAARRSRQKHPQRAFCGRNGRPEIVAPGRGLRDDDHEALSLAGQARFAVV